MEDKVKLALASLSQTEASRKALAGAIIEWVKPNQIATDVVGLFLNTRQLQAGDMLVKRLRKPGIRVRKYVPGTIHLHDEIAVSDRVNYVLDGHVVKVMVNMWDLERGELGTVQDIRQDMVNSLTKFFAMKVFYALSTVWNSTNTPDNYTEVSGSLSKAALDDAIDRINYRAGSVRAIVGVKNSLLPITEFAGYSTYDGHKQYSDTILTEALSNGWIGRYRGVSNIIGLEQQWDNPEDNTPMIPEQYVLVVGGNAGEFVTFGDVMWKDYVDNRPTPPYFVLEAVVQWGLVVDWAENIFVIKIT